MSGPHEGRPGGVDHLVDAADRDAIHDLKARYFLCVDTKRWESLRRLFTDDARFAGFLASPDGPDAFVEGVAALLGDAVSVHHGFMPQLRARSATVVRGRWAMVDRLWWPPGSRSYRGRSAPDLTGRRGYGYYEEEYRRTPDGWRIAYMRLARLRVELIHGLPVEDDIEAHPDPDWV